MNVRTAVIWMLGLLGVVLSYWKFAEWISANSFNMIYGWEEAFSTSLWGTGLLLDLCACTLLILFLGVRDRKFIGTRWSLAVVGTTIVFGVSLGIACYVLGLRHLMKTSSDTEETTT